MMTLMQDREQWVALVTAAQRGDAAPWPDLIERFEDLAVASAVGLGGDIAEAADIAQEAFVLAFRHIATLQDPAAFPSWLLRLVRTATSRRTRRSRLATVPLDELGGDASSAPLVDGGPGPDDTVLAGMDASRVRAAVERLPEGERCVIALHYLAGMSYAEVAEFLDIGVSAAKKRAWSARAKLEELLPMVSDALSAARPSGDGTFRDSILVFQAIRTRDVDALARLLEHNPALATIDEDWPAAQGFEARLGFAERATALIRAAGTGDVRLVRLLVEAGAPVADECGCVDGETALMAAVNVGATDVVEYLLANGASANVGAFDGDSTVLHVAVHRDRHDLVPKLLAAGADPGATDAHGRTAADWAAIRGARPLPSAHDDLLWTRIRAIDLLAPLPRGARVWFPPAYGLGAMRTVFAMIDALGPARFWMLGFEHGPYEPVEFEIEARESGTEATIDLVGAGRPEERRARFGRSVERLGDDPSPKLVMAVPSPGHEHDVTVALPGLAADPSVLATVVVATYTDDPAPVPAELPDGFDARIAFDRARARARCWPAIDPAHTSVRVYPSERHEELATRARGALVAYAMVDPTFAFPEPRMLADPDAAERAQTLIAYLSHAHRPFEMLAGAPAPDTSFAELLDTVEGILS